jgi:hypothetical protein
LKIAFMLVFSVSVKLHGVMMLDSAEQLAQHFDELRGRFVGEPRK